MRVGWLISLTAHALLIVVALWDGIFRDRERPDLTRVTEVSIIDPSDLELPASAPEEAPEAAPEISDELAFNPLEAPTFDPNAPPPPDDDIAPVQTVQDYVEDPSEQDQAADMSAVRTRVIEPEVATEVDAPDEEVASLPAQSTAPALSGFDRSTSAPRAPALGRPPAPRQAPRIADSFTPPAPPKPQKPAEEQVAAVDPEDVAEPLEEEQTEPLEETPDPVAEEVPQDTQEEQTVEESTEAPTTEEASGEEDPLAYLSSTLPRGRPQDFEQQAAAAAERERERLEAERLAAEQAEREAEEARLAAEQAAREEEERLAREAAEREEQERLAAEQAQQEAEEAEAARLAEEERLRREQEEIAAALAAAAAAEEAATAPAQGETAAEAPAGPPLTGAEKEGLRLAVQACWNIPAGLENAQDLRVVVSVELDPDGRIIAGPTLIEPASAERPEIRTAYEAARRALLRCQGAGYQLPRDKYEQWRNLEVGFDPQGMLARW